MVCGKIAAGKSTLAAQLAADTGAVLIAEDVLLSALYGDQMSSPRDYVRYAGRLRAAMGPHIAAVLRSGTSVILDFQANTVESRTWMRGILDASGAQNQLHVLDPPDETCLERLRSRNATGEHPFTVTDAQFHQINAYFAPPTPDEGFTVIRHDHG